MIRDRRSYLKRATVVVAGLLLLLQLSALMLPRDLAPPAPLSWVLRLVPALANAVTTVATVVDDGIDAYVLNRDAAKLAQTLQSDNERLRFALAWQAAELHRRRDLDELLGWTPRPWDGAVVRAVLHDAADRYRTLWIAAPAGADVANHAVATSHGLVGRIIRSNGRYAQVLLLTDAQSAVDVVAASGARAVVQGTGQREGRLAYVPRYEPLEAGETLVTSGRDGAFPGGIPVGEVTTVDRDAENIYLEASVRFFESPDKVEWLRTLPPPPRPGARAAP